MPTAENLTIATPPARLAGTIGPGVEQMEKMPATNAWFEVAGTRILGIRRHRNVLCQESIALTRRPELLTKLMAPRTKKI
jgi:hypothetical protein